MPPIFAVRDCFLHAYANTEHLVTQMVFTRNMCLSSCIYQLMLINNKKVKQLQPHLKNDILKSCEKKICPHTTVKIKFIQMLVEVSSPLNLLHSVHWEISVASDVKLLHF